jgi:hypothetical protein
MAGTKPPIGFEHFPLDIETVPAGRRFGRIYGSTGFSRERLADVLVAAAGVGNLVCPASISTALGYGFQLDDDFREAVAHLFEKMKAAVEAFEVLRTGVAGEAVHAYPTSSTTQGTSAFFNECNHAIGSRQRNTANRSIASFPQSGKTRFRAETQQPANRLDVP